MSPCGTPLAAVGVVISHDRGHPDRSLGLSRCGHTSGCLRGTEDGRVSLPQASGACVSRSLTPDTRPGAGDLERASCGLPALMGCQGPPSLGRSFTSSLRTASSELRCAASRRVRITAEGGDS